MTRYYNYVYSFIAARVSDFADTEDILQETFLTAILKQERLSDQEKLRAWLCGIAENKIRQHNRRHAILSSKTARCPDAQENEPQCADRTDDRMIALDELTLLKNSVIELPNELRQCAVIRLMCGLSGEDAAQILQIPVQTVYNRTHKAKQLLRERLGGKMELLLEKFDALTEQNISDTERTANYLHSFYELNAQQKYREMAQLLLSAPVFAADSPMAHYIIMQYCAMAARTMNLNADDPIISSLGVLGEREFRLAQKLGLRGILDDDTGEEIEEYTFYIGAADFYCAIKRFDSAHEMCTISEKLGNPSELQRAMIFQGEEKYEQALTVFLRVAESPDCQKSDRYMAYNRISNCYRALGDHRAQLSYQLLTYNAVKNGDIYSEPSAHRRFLSGEAYYLAYTYAQLNERENMLYYLNEAVSLEPRFAEWAKAHPVFSNYQSDPDFVKLCGTGTGNLTPIY